MKQIAFALLICMAATRGLAQGTEKEKVAMAYYSGYEKHNWNMVVSQFADSFTFTSPNNDNHISVEKFKEKCWPTNKFFKKVKFIKMAESGDDLFLLVEIATTDNKVVRNVDLFNFHAGKIKSIETFFGHGEWFPGNKK
jgi:hypothetical protein